MLQKESNVGHVTPVTETIMPSPKNKLQGKVNGSLSDGSVCDIAPLTKAAVDRYQQMRQHQKFVAPSTFKSNGVQSRKRFVSMGDKDQNASSGYETSSKKSKRDRTISPVIKTYNPVMENMVSSTNNDIVYKFTGPTPSENFEVTYTVEERVKAAAYAIVYKNCKISTEKFEAFYDKPAPDFKTIFRWRQRLLSTGCLVDSHVDNKNGPIDNATQTNVVLRTDDSSHKAICKVKNPEEIVIDSESDEETNNTQHKVLARSYSAETLVIAPEHGSGASTVEDRGSHAGSHSQSTHRRACSSSRDSQDSNYPDTDSERLGTKSVNSRTGSYSKSANLSARQSIDGTDSDSISFDSADDNFLSRVFPNRDGRKRRKLKKRPVVAPGPSPASMPKVNSYVPNEIQHYEGYSTAKTNEKSPLVTGNIYTSNLRNMNVKPRASIPIDIDNCSTEYIPTRLGLNTKQNYEQFKDNVRKKGYWAKGNGTAIVKNKRSVSTDVALTPKPVEVTSQREITITNYSSKVESYVAPITKLSENPIDDFTKDDIDNFLDSQQYLAFEDRKMKPECTDRIFALVQSNNSSKQKSITDIFNVNGSEQVSSDADKELEKLDSMHKVFEAQWDEDDDDLYKQSPSNDPQPPVCQSPSPSIGSHRALSPMSNMLYATNTQPNEELTPKKPTGDSLKAKRDMLSGLLKDFQHNEIGEALSPLKGVTPQNQISSQEEEEKLEVIIPNEIHKVNTSSIMTLFSKPEPIPTDLPEKVLRLPMNNTNMDESQNKQDSISPAKKVHILESVTIQPPLAYNFITSDHQNVHHSQLTKLTTNEVSKVHSIPGVESNKNMSELQHEMQNFANQPAPQIDVSNLLVGINTNTLLLALQNLQQLSQNSSLNYASNDKQDVEENSSKENNQAIETINLTNDEEWEKESNRDGSIERQLERLDGNTGDAAFLGDIFDPKPVHIPQNVSRKLNLGVDESDETLNNSQMKEDPSVIGNFKSFALPKPILLNRLKLTVKTVDKGTKKSVDGKRLKKKIKVCI